MRNRRIGALCLGAALSLTFTNLASAGIEGSTYDFSTSVSGNTDMSPLGGPTTHTDPANPGFCVGPPVDCGAGSGLSGSFSFTDLTPTSSIITFTFFGSTAGAGPGSFSIDLGNFATVDGNEITSVTYAGGNLLSGDFSNVIWDGTHAIFTGSADFDYDAFGGATVTFDVGKTPEPSSMALLGGSLLGLGATRRRHNRA